jgi:hypothetical protein
MRRSLTWLGVAAGTFAFWRWRRHHRQPAPPALDPAEELKQKLAESRTGERPAQPAAAGAAEAERPARPEAPLDERRRAVHDRARQAIDEMLGGEDLPGEEE